MPCPKRGRPMTGLPADGAIRSITPCIRPRSP
ncbi:hypothetical protein RB2654_14645 [Rhodobacterales bacterium HTCC2654]|uniref:Uncharacterized protein n=1 Tax=Maritimibacter alkaliphilus HTCC2654 TaxID=314271 RepID=A3VGX8_9RHOB|nr:hypothetical protein RB2654_14645 [Rhodobacterales bacterium HTCC2654] [Maritimibacter alkaliphilus HTCC2654]